MSLLQVLKPARHARLRLPLALLAVISALTALPLIGGCGGSSSSDNGGTGSGTFRVTLVDAPPSAGAVSAVNVTIDRVEANVDGAWQPISSVPQSFSLLDLVKNE